MGKANDYARIRVTVLEPAGRAPAVPEDTRAKPLEMFVKGHLTADAAIGGPATVVTKTGRLVSGTLLEIDPRYTHSFGAYVPELDRAGDEAVAALFGGDDQ